MNRVTDKQITPAMFLSKDDPLPPRIIGVECEYNIQTTDQNGVEHYPGEYISKPAMDRAGIRNIGGFTELGSRLYQDVGHAEYCTPECLGPYQAAAADLAGVAILSSIIEASGIGHRGVYRISGTSIEDDTNDKRLRYTNGVHENFMAPSELVDSRYIMQLLPTYYATRVATMAGTVARNKYEFSQKAQGIGGHPIETYLARRTSAGQKPMALALSNEPDTVGHGWLRLETRFVDAPFSLASRRHALATTSLMLRLCEHIDLFNSQDFDDIIIKEPVHAAHAFMADLSLRHQTEVHSGKKRSMLDISEELAKKVLYLCERVNLPADEVDAAHEWPRIIDAFRHSNPQNVKYDEHLLRHYGVATKHYWLNKIGAFEKGDAEAKTRSLQWDRVLPKGNGRQLMERVDAQDPEVLSLQQHAPITRAAVRAQYIINSQGDLGARVNGWNHGGGQMDSSFTFSDPYGYRP